MRVFEQAPVEGAAVEGGRAIGLRVGGEVRRAGLVVGADGLDSPVRRSLRLDDRPRIHTGRASACACTFGSPPAGASRTGWRSSSAAATSCTRRRCPTASCCSRRSAVATRSVRDGGARTAFERWIADEPLLRDWLDGATPLTTPAGRAPVTRRARAGFAPGAVLLGDAAGSTDPLTAGGIAHALVTAERLAAIVPRVLAEGDVWLRALRSRAPRGCCARTTG